MTTYTIVAFYKFVTLTELPTFQAKLKKFCREKNILGTILLAHEGINGTVVGKETHINALISFLRAYQHLANLDCKYSSTDFLPFQKIKVVIKKEIVTFGIPNLNPQQITGTHVNHEEWNQLISSPDVLVIDTRNTYEVDLGTFKGAANPKTQNFRDFPHYVKENLDPTQHKKIAMYCTGGIRCEKASTFLLQQGFENVYQLNGGILRYLEQVQPQDSLWEGECFIFDDRITIKKESIKSSVNID